MLRNRRSFRFLIIASAVISIVASSAIAGKAWNPFSDLVSSITASISARSSAAATNSAKPADERSNVALNGPLSPDAQNAKVVYQKGPNSSADIYLITPGTGISMGLRRGYHPAFSPDGTKIAFVDNTAGATNGFIRLMNADGTNVRNLAQPRQGFSPTWSPDGTRLAFVRGDFDSVGDDGKGTLYVIDMTAGSEGANETVIPTTMQVSRPSWGANNRIAFSGLQPHPSGGNDVLGIHVTGAIPPSGQVGSNPPAVTAISGSNTNDRDAAWSYDGTQIAFLSTRDYPMFNGSEIYVMDPQGANVRRVTNASNFKSAPAWSPDGTKLVYSRGGSMGSLNANLGMVNADGSNGTTPVFVTNFGSGDVYPNWGSVPQAPVTNGRIYYGDGPNTSSNIISFDPASGVFGEGTNLGRGYHPAVSPDGNTIAFVDNTAGATNNQIMLMNSNGSNRRALPHPATGFTPTWSPDGKRLAYVVGNFASGENGSGNIWVMDMVSGNEGANQTIIPNTQNSSNPKWGPNNYILYYSRVSPVPGVGISKIGPIPATSQIASNPPTATYLAGDPNDREADWSPDGTKIAFRSFRDYPTFASSEIYIMNSDGTGVARLTNEATSKANPTWAPDGTSIAYDSGQTSLRHVKPDGSDGASPPALKFSTARFPNWARASAAPPSTGVDLSMESMSDSSDPVLEGSNFNYKFTLLNKSSSTATGVKIVFDPIPENISLHAIMTHCSMANDRKVTCTYSDIAGGASITPNVTFLAEDDGTIDVKATVSSNENDPFPNNNFKTETTTILGPPTSCTGSPQNLIHWYPFDENRNDIIGGKTGSVEGSLFFETGKVKQAATFNGTNNAVISQPTNTLNNYPVTIEAWVRPAMRNDGTDFPTNVVSNDRQNFGGLGFGVNVFNGGSQMKVEYGSGFRTVPGVSFTADTWYHVAVVFTNGNVRSYVNGTEVDSFNFAPSALNGVSFIRIGKHNDDVGLGTRRFFRGRLDEVSIYSRPLSAGEILVLSHSGSFGKCLPGPGTVNLDVSLTGPPNNSPVETDGLRYVTRIRNTGTSAATDVVFTDSMPQGTKVNSVITSKGSCDPIPQIEGTVRCVIGSVGVGEDVLVTIFFRALNSGSKTNFSRIVSTQRNRDSNSVTTNFVEPVDLSALIEGPAEGGINQLTYNIKATNNSGSIDAHGVTLATEFSDDDVIVDSINPGSSTVSCGQTPGKITCNIPTIERKISGTAVTYGIQVKMRPRNDKVSRITQNVTVTAGNPPDNNVLNNQASLVTNIKAGSDLQVTMSAPEQVTDGSEFDYFVFVRNNGPTAATQGLYVLNQLPSEVDWVSTSGGGVFTCDPPFYKLIGCSLERLESGQQLSIRIRVKPRASVKRIKNTASVQLKTYGTNAADPVPDNNSATRETSVCIPGSGGAPVFKSTSVKVVAAGQFYNYRPWAEDPKGQAINYLLSQGPPGMTINQSTGELRWTPTSAFVGQAVPIKVLAANGTCSGTSEQSFALNVVEAPPPGGYRIQMGQVDISASSLVRVGANGQLSKTNLKQGKPGADPVPDGVYKIGGDTRINQFIRFDGDVTITVDKAHDRIGFDISEGKLEVTNVPLLGNKVIWQGNRTSFNVNGQGVLTAINQIGAIDLLQVAGLRVLGINNAQILFAQKGIRLDGKVNVPIPGVANLTTNITSLEISQVNGVKFLGDIALPDFDLGGIGIKKVKLSFKPGDVFEGEGEISIPGTKFSGKVKLIAGALESVHASLSTSPGVPIPPFFNISGGSVQVDGLKTGQFALGMFVDVTLLNAALADIIQLSKAGVVYRAPGSISIQSDLRVFTAKLAQAAIGADIVNKQFSFSGKTTFVDGFPVIIASAHLAGGSDSKGKVFIESAFGATVQIPDGDDPLRGALKFWGGVQFPVKLANVIVMAQYPPGTLRFQTSFPVIGDVATEVARNTVGNVAVAVGRNFGDLTKVFALSKEFENASSEAYQRRMLKHFDRDPDSRFSALYIPASGQGLPQTVGTLTIAPETPLVILRLFGTGGAPRFSLIAPDGTQITPDNAEAKNALFAQDDEKNESYFLLTKPMEGEWEMQVENDALGPFVFDGAGGKAAPVINTVEASQAGSDVSITYNVSDPDGDARVSLFYSADLAGSSPQLIVDDLPLDEAGQYVWSTSDGAVPSGDYYVYAVAADDFTTPVRKFGSTMVQITDPRAPATPQGVTVTPGGKNNLLVEWTPNTEADLKGYQVRYGIENGDDTVLDQSIDAGKETSIHLMGLAELTTYRVSVVAYSGSTTPDPNDPVSSFHTSRPSPALSATTAIAIVPTVDLSSLNGGESVEQDSDVNISWMVDQEDLLYQQVELSTDDGETYTPLALNLDAAQRNFRWHVPTAVTTDRARIRISVSDLAGNVGVASSASSFSIVLSTQPPPPPPPFIDVSGRVVTAENNGLRSAMVSMVDEQGVRRTTLTSSLGYFAFTAVPRGGTYTITVSSKRYRFTPRTLQIASDITLEDFVGQE